MDIQKEIDNINESVTKEDLKNASMEELLKYAELNLEIRKKIEMLQALENK